jgi:GTP-binding protein
MTGQRIDQVLEAAERASEENSRRITTGVLNEVISEATTMNPPPASHGKRLRIYYAAQVGRRPPRFAVQVNERRLISRDWAYHFENRLREAYGLEGIPLVIDFVPHTRRQRPRSGISAQQG